MYTIHYANKKLILISNGTQAGSLVIKVENETFADLAIESIFSFFEKNSPDITLYLSSNNPEGLMNHLGKFFKTLTAAGGLVRNNQQNLLFIFRYGRWDLPKGVMEATETAEEAAKREIAEETGIVETSLIGPIGKTFHAFTLEGTWYLKTTHWFLFSTPSTQMPIGQKEEGIDNAIWAKPEMLNTLLTNTYENIRQVIETAFAKNYL